MDIEKRVRMAAESILENESLREGLNDEAASALLDWGVARAKQISAETADLEDDNEADEAVYPRMRALRKILRAAASLCAETVEPAQQTGLLQEIADQVPIVYGPSAVFETGNWAAQSGNPAQIINRLRALIEGSANNPAVAKTPTAQPSEKKEAPKDQETQKKGSFFDWLFRR